MKVQHNMPEYEANTTFPQAVQTLWDLDANRLTPEEDYRIDVQRSKHPCDKDDAADDPLFTYVNEDVFNRPTYAAFRKLLDNYSVEVGREEKVGQRELDEQRDFLDAVMETEPMKYLHKYCLAKNAHYNNREVTDSEADFKKILTNIWFDLYSRSRGSRGDSSGFEHVFAGEVRELFISQDCYLYSFAHQFNVIESFVVASTLSILGKRRQGIWVSQLDNVLD